MDKHPLNMTKLELEIYYESQLSESQEQVRKLEKALSKIQYYVGDSAYKDKGHECEHKKMVMSIGDMLKALLSETEDQ